MSKTQPARAFLETSSLFSGLPGVVLDKLEKLVHPANIAAHQVLFIQGDKPDGCYGIISGSLKASVLTSEGEEMTLAVFGAGDIVGEMGLVDGAPRSATVTAAKAAELMFLPAGAFDQFASQNPEIYKHLLRIISVRLRATNDALAACSTLPLSGRLARVLLRLSEGFGHHLQGGRILIRQTFTQSDLSKMAGAARENVSRQINEWRREQVLSKISHYYCIENHDMLRKIAHL